VSCHRFHQRVGHGWRYVGWDAADEHGDGDMPVVEAFRRLVKVEELHPGEYRYQRSDVRNSSELGHLLLNADGTILPGSDMSAEPG